MPTPRTSFRRRLVGAVAATSVIATLLAGAAIAATSTKPYHVDIVPDLVPAGAHRTYTVTIFNDSNQPVLGSANWTVNPAFSDVALVSLPTGASLEGGQPVGNVFKLRNLSIEAMSFKSFQYEATAPCVANTYQSSVNAKQSNDYKGPPGNDFVLDTTSSDLGVEVTNDCEFAFAFGGAPADSQIDTNITTEVYLPSGDPITVVVLDGAGALAANVEATVTLGIGHNAGCDIVPPCGTLSGDKTEATVDGVAEFERPAATPDDPDPNALTIDFSGIGYTLRATGVIDGVTFGNAPPYFDSPPFDVQDVGRICDGGACQGTAYGKEFQGATYILDAEADQGDLLTVGVTTSVIDCANLQAEFGLTFVPHTDTVTTDFTGDGTKTLTMSFTNTRRESKSSFRVCYSQPDLLDLEGVAVPWVDRFGVTRSGEAESYLQDCSKTTPRDMPPCVISVDSDPTKPKIIIIKVLLPEGDPKGRG